MNNNTESIRQGLWNYIGMIMSNCTLETEEERKQYAVALISEELAKLSKNPDDSLNITVAKPILRNAEWILSKRIEDIENKAKQLSVGMSTDNITDYLEELRNSLKNYLDIMVK